MLARWVCQCMPHTARSVIVYGRPVPPGGGWRAAEVDASGQVIQSIKVRCAVPRAHAGTVSCIGMHTASKAGGQPCEVGLVTPPHGRRVLSADEVPSRPLRTPAARPPRRWASSTWWTWRAASACT